MADDRKLTIYCQSLQFSQQHTTGPFCALGHIVAQGKCAVVQSVRVIFILPKHYAPLDFCPMFHEFMVTFLNNYTSLFT